MRSLLVAAVAAGIAGCSDSGPVKIGQDTYAISIKVMASGAGR